MINKFSKITIYELLLIYELTIIDMEPFYLNYDEWIKVSSKSSTNVFFNTTEFNKLCKKVLFSFSLGSSTILVLTNFKDGGFKH